MSTAEIALPITKYLPENTQVNISAWIERLKYGLASKQEIITDITHTFAEFACSASLVDYSYVQKENDIVPLGGTDSIFDIMKRGANTEWSRLQVNEGLEPLFRKILEVEKPSISVIFSPPGPESEGHSDYGYAYIGEVPELDENNQRTIKYYALRINDCDSETVFKCLRFLSGFARIENIKPTKDETLLTNSIVFPLGQTAPMPPDAKGNFLTMKVETIEDLFFLLAQHLPRKFRVQDIKKGLSGISLKEVYEKFKPTIHSIYTKLWSSAHGTKYQFQAWTEKKVEAMLMQHMSLASGSCPAAASSQNSTLTNAEKKDGQNNGRVCPKCGMYYTEDTCPYC